MIVEDVLIGYFLLFWLIDLIAELKRSEPIDFKRMLFLPISLRTVFLLNFSISIASPLFVVFIMPLITFSITASFKAGPKMLLAIPLGLIFYFMLAAWTYYVQGILSFLMQNKRRRQKILMLIPLVFIVPSLLINPAFSPNFEKFDSIDFSSADEPEPVAEADSDKAGIPGETKALSLGVELKDAQDNERDAYITYIVTTANSFFPFGWFPLGMAMLLEGRFLSALHCFASLAALAGFGLFLGYRSTLRFHTLPPSVGRTRNRGTSSSSRRPFGQRLIGLHLPVLDNTTAGVVSSSFLTSLRHPTVWVMFSAPLVIGWIFFMVVRNIEHLGLLDSLIFKTMITSFTSTVMIMLPFFATITLFTNMFGLDIGGFRAYVLLPMPRWKYLFGYNCMLFVGAGTMALLMFLFSSMFIHYRIAAFTISILQIVQLGLTLCIIGNLTSIYFPYYIDLQGTKPGLRQQLILMLVGISTLFIIGLMSIPVAFATTVDTILVRFFSYQGFSIRIITSLGMVGLISLVYWLTLPRFGKLLQQREKIILSKLMKMKA